MPSASQQGWRQVPFRAARKPKPKPKVEALNDDATEPLPPCVAGLIRSRQNVDGRNGDAPIHTEVRKGHVDCVAALIKAGANVNLLSRTGGAESPLILAAALGDVQCIKLLIAAGADVNRPSGDWDYAIHAAVRGRHPACIRVLVAAGAKLDVQDQDLEFPLFRAVSCGYVDCVAALLEAGADLNERSDGLTTALHVAARFCHLDCAAALIMAGADPNARDCYGKTPLADAILHRSWFEGDILHCIELLIDAGADVDAVDNNGETALFCAGEEDVVQALLCAGTNLKHVDIDGATPLSRAACGFRTGAASLRLLRKTVTDDDNTL